MEMKVAFGLANGINITDLMFSGKFLDRILL